MNMDQKKMAEGIRAFLDGLDRGFEGDDQLRTPERVARAWAEDLLSGYSTDPGDVLTWSPAPAGGGPVLVRRIHFSSMCVHHLLPFFGMAHIAYLPGERLAGLSKISRVVEAHARRLQTQEHLTAGIVGTIAKALQPRGVLALLEAEHTCMTLRGVRQEQSLMVTMAASGLYEEDAAVRSGMIDLMMERGSAGAG
jgi:GTP cyclohydrolase I